MKKKIFCKCGNVPLLVCGFILLSLVSTAAIYPAEESQEKPAVENIGAKDLRIIAGYEISAASSASGAAKEFVDLYLSWPLPVGFNKEIMKGGVKIKPWRLWGNFRLTSLPQQNDKNSGVINSEYFSEMPDLNINKISQAGEFLVGLDYTLGVFSQDKEGQKFTFGFIVALGASTVKDPKTESIQIYNISDRFKARYPGYDYTDNTKYVAFAAQDRNRFYHQYYLGIRFKSLDTKNGISIPIFQFDASYGINDAASGGHGNFFKKAVFQVNGFINMEIFKIPVYFFGSMVLNVNKEKVQLPLFLDPAPDGVTLTSPELLIVSKDDNDRDFYRIGVGVNVFKLLAKIYGNGNQ